MFIPSTYNSVIHSREAICKSLFDMTNIHNLGNIDTAKHESSFYNLTKPPTDDFTKQMAVFKKN